MPNRYPAFPRQEVVVHAPHHVRSFADLEEEQVSLVARAWRERARAARAAGLAYVHPLVNEGRAAGASLPHSHSQLVWMDDVPPAVRIETADGLAELLRELRRQTRELEVERTGAAAAFCHPAGRAPYETLILDPSAGDTRGLESDGLPALLLCLRNVVRRLRAAEGPVPWNAWVHTLPSLHLELVPRLTVFAGVELGAGIFVNAVAPEDAAAALRRAGTQPD